MLLIMTLAACTFGHTSDYSRYQTDDGGGDGGGDGTGTTTDPCVDDPTAPCCAAPAGWLMACGTGFPAGEEVNGFFAEATPGDERLTVTWRSEGENASVVFYGDEATLAKLPDLVAIGATSVVDDGGCGWDGEGASGGSFVVRDFGDRPLLAVGNGPVTDASGISVSVDSADSTCEARPSDFSECVDETRNVPVSVGYDDAQATLYQGDQANLEGLEFHLLLAELPVGDSDCTDATGWGFSWMATGSY